MEHAIGVDGPGGRAVTAITSALLADGPLLRSELADRVGLSLPSMTRLTRPLIEAGLIVEDAESVPSTTGRPAKRLDVRADAMHFVGIKLTGTEAIGVLTDLRATELRSLERPIEDRSPDAVVDLIVALCAELTDDVSISAVGVSLGGRVRDSGFVTHAPFLAWTDVDLGRMLARRLDVPVSVENDLISLTAAELWFGQGRGLSSFAVISIGAGVGYGLVVNGAIVNAPDTGLGLGGHIPLEDNGPLCFLGHRGCSTAILAIPGMLSQYHAATGREIDYDTLIDRALDGDAVAHPIIDTATRGLGRFVGLVANLAMLNDVVLAGEGIRLVTEFADDVREQAHADRDPQAVRVELHIDDSGFVPWARGAASTVIPDSLAAAAAHALGHSRPSATESSGSQRVRRKITIG